MLQAFYLFQMVSLFAPQCTREEAVARVQLLALRVLADKLEDGEVTPN